MPVPLTGAGGTAPGVLSQFINYTSGTASATTTVNSNVPAGTGTDDMLVALCVKSVTSGTWNTPAGGWAVAVTEFVQGANFEAVVFTRLATGSDTPGSPLTFTCTTAGNLHVALMTFRGPRNKVNGVSNDDVSAVLTHPIDASSVTVPGGGGVALYFAIHQTNATNWTSPSGYDEIADLYAVNLGLTMHYDIVTSGSLGTVTGTSAASRRANNVALALSVAP